MQKLTKEEVEKLRETKPFRSGTVLFGQEIAELKKGDGLQISASDWTRKTPPNQYYPAKFNKGGQRVIAVSKIGDGEYLIEKL